MTGIFSGNHPVYEAASLAFSALFEGKGMVCRIIDGTRDYLVSRGMPKEEANDTVLKVRQMFFDPFASPGRHPTTDPEFKKMLPLFFETTMLMVNVFNYGTSRYDRERAEGFAPKFVAYVREHFPDGAPRLPMSEFLGMVEEIDAGKPAFSPRVGDYRYIRVHDWEELKELSGIYGLDAWCNVKNPSDWDRYSLNGQGKFYLLYTDDAAETYGKLSVIGITVNHYGKIVYAFDRDNDCVDRDAVRQIAEHYGLNRPFAVDFGTAMDLVRHGYSCREVYPYFNELDSRHAAVGFDDRDDMCILDTDSWDYASDTFTELSRVRNSDALLILDGTKLYDLGREEVILDTGSLGGLWLKPGGYDPDTMLFWLTADGGRPVNAVCIDDSSPEMLLDIDNATPVAKAVFTPATPGKFPTVSGMEPGDFWVVAAGDGQYIVTSPGNRLDECKFVEDPAGTGINVVLSASGYYMHIEGRPGEDRRYFLMKDGRRVFDREFADAGREDDGSIFLIDDEGEYRFDPETGNVRKA